MLQNARVTAFIVSELLRENQQGEGVSLPPPLAPPPILGLTAVSTFSMLYCLELRRVLPSTPSLRFATHQLQNVNFIPNMTPRAQQLVR